MVTKQMSKWTALPLKSATLRVISCHLLTMLMNASLGTSTLPIIRIRFLPSACLFNNLVFLVMSPPYWNTKTHFFNISWDRTDKRYLRAYISKNLIYLTFIITLILKVYIWYSISFSFLTKAEPRYTFQTEHWVVTTLS